MTALQRIGALLLALGVFLGVPVATAALVVDPLAGLSRDWTWFIMFVGLFGLVGYLFVAAWLLRRLPLMRLWETSGFPITDDSEDRAISRALFVLMAAYLFGSAIVFAVDDQVPRALLCALAGIYFSVRAVLVWRPAPPTVSVSEAPREHRVLDAS